MCTNTTTIIKLPRRRSYPSSITTQTQQRSLLSCVSIFAVLPMENLTLTSLLKQVSVKYPDRRAISVSGKFDITHARLDQLIEHAASLLVSAGIKPADVVALTFPNTVEVIFYMYIISLFCCFILICMRHINVWILLYFGTTKCDFFGSAKMTKTIVMCKLKLIYQRYCRRRNDNQLTSILKGFRN